MVKEIKRFSKHTEDIENRVLVIWGVFLLLVLLGLWVLVNLLTKGV